MIATRKTICLMLMSGCLWAADAVADAPGAVITLQETVTVSEERIVLRDVAEVEGETDAGDLVVGNSPWPGSSRRVSAALVRMRLLGEGYDLRQFEFRGPETAVVTRSAHRIEPEKIIDTARKHLRNRFPAGLESAQISLIGDCPPVVVGEASKDGIKLLPSTRNNGRKGTTVTVDVDVINNGRRLKRIPLRFSVSVEEKVAIAGRHIRTGERIEREDVQFRVTNVGGLSGAPLTDPDALAGKVAARSISPGQVITVNAIGEPEPEVVVRTNQRVTLVFNNGSLSMDTSAKALHGARVGERVRVENLISGRIVEGVAREDGVVEVGSSANSQTGR